jgi:hypothetical protein
MLMHSCQCILFIVVTGFYLFAKRFKNNFEIGFGKINLEKEKKSFVSPSLPHFRPVGLFPPLARSFSRVHC